jgi:hypothetical protein
VTLIQYDFAIFTSVHHQRVDFTVADNCASREKIAQTKLQNVNHIFLTIKYCDRSVKVIQIWIWQLCRNDKVYFLLEVVSNLFLYLLHWQFWFEVSLSVELSRLYVASDFPVFISCF